MSVSAPATSPPVQLSAVASISPRALQASSTSIARARMRASLMGRPPAAQRGGGERGQPFAAAGESEALGGGGLQPDLPGPRPVSSISRASIASRWGPIRGASQTMEMSTWSSRPPRAATRPQANRRKAEEAAPFQRGSEGGKCRPMSPRRARRRSRRTARDRPRRRPNGPERRANAGCDGRTGHMVAVGEGVDVVARAHPRHERPRQPLLRHVEIRLRRQLDVAGIAIDDPHRMAGALHDARVVGRLEVARRRIGRAQQAEPERLRRLHGAQGGAVGRGAHDAALHLLDRVGHSRRGDGRAGAFGRREDAGRQPRRQEGPGAVMHADQHVVRPLDGGEPKRHGRRARRAAHDRRQEARAQASGRRAAAAWNRSSSSGWITTKAASMSAQARAARSVRVSTGSPPSVRYCFGRPSPAREPRPAATISMMRPARSPMGSSDGGGSSRCKACALIVTSGNLVLQRKNA